MKQFILICGLIFAPLFMPVMALAQPQLPAIAVNSQDGINILSWINPFTDGVASVSILHSMDSTLNFQVIGTIKNTAEAKQTFVDARPQVGTNWYQVVVLFQSGTDWKSNVTKVILDSASIAKRINLPPNDSLQKLVDHLSNQKPDDLTSTLKQTATYPKSQYVFTNPFTGDIDIELADVRDNDYKLFFYDLQGKEVLIIPRINAEDVILDKRNFQISGTLKFKILRNNQEFATGYVTIY